jgi:ABC-type branched-subunit amino acid transport system substrate-binding protein
MPNGKTRATTRVVTTSRRSLLKNSAATAVTLSLGGRFASAQAETVRIGVVYDLSGPFAAGGSVACSVGAQIAIDLVNERGGVAGKYKVVPINADCQSKVDVAINEVERLIGQEKVEIVNGVYASAHAVPLSAKVEAQKKILWITTAIATAVFKDKNLQYVFRAQIHSDQYAEAFVSFIGENAKAKLGTEPKDVKIAVIHEDGPYGVGVAEGTERFAKEKGLRIVMREGYSATAPDLSSLVTKLKRAGADVISHCGYNPDITLFLRQARESGLRFKMLVGNGAGYSQLDKLRQDQRQRRATALLDGFQPDLGPAQQRTAGRQGEVRRLRRRGGAQGRARRRHSARRHHPGLRREILSPRHAARRPERALDAGRHAECRRAHLGGVAEQHQDPGARAAAAGIIDLRHAKLIELCKSAS